jgi:Nucleoside-diphosphate-sugar pyrophosphorylase involved in lipopolysaccharide biosynthesis/translation initiation factor 2B, gamma/epsilon subunits (eIF-2Bgamma/eIF-2Bepsilon)
MCQQAKHALITEERTIREAIEQLNENGLQILLVINNDRGLLGTVTDGDIRRSILNNITLDKPITKIMNKNPKFVYEGETDKARALMVKYKLKNIPIVDEFKRVIDLALIGDLIESKEKYPLKDNQVFIMAGGKGSRLDPFTKILPKPLIPIGDKPIIEIIMNSFRKFGFNNFIVSLNYKAEIIKLYFLENANGFNVSYTHEDMPLGTAGALQLAKDRLSETFIVSNCDVIIDVDFDKLLAFHKRNKNFATVVGVVKHMQIPYGVIEVKDNKLHHMTEKPEYDFVINSGVYVLEPEIIDLIPSNEPYNMPDLLLEAKELGHKVGVFPVSNKWFDIGQWEEYQNTLEYFRKVEGTANNG